MTEQSLMRFMEHIYKKTFGPNRRYALKHNFAIIGSNQAKKTCITAVSPLIPHLTYKFEYVTAASATNWSLFIFNDPNILLYSYQNTLTAPISSMEYVCNIDQLPKGISYLKKKAEDLKLYPAELQGLVLYNFS